MSKDMGASVPDQALVASDQAASRLAPTGFDPSRIRVVGVRESIRGVAELFRQQHGRDFDSVAHWNPRQTKCQIYDALRALNAETATSKDVAAIIGNDAWIGERCDFCGVKPEWWFELGDEPDYEARYLYACPPCLEYLAAIAMEAAKPDRPHSGLDPEGDSAGPKDIAQTPQPSTPGSNP
jgi:hypothetical protein